jgi:peptidyl-prolyl cis-trans isomerase D
MAVSDQTFNEIIVENEAFQSAGRFDKNQYQYQLSRLGFTPLEYREEVKKELLANQLATGLQASAIVTAPQTTLFSRLVLQARSYDYLSLPLSSFKDNLEVSEEEVENYYENRGDNFFEPDKVVVEYLELTPAVVEPFVEIDEEALRARFDALQASAEASGASWNLAHILIENNGEGREALEQVQQKLAAGEDFAELAKAYSTDFGSAQSGGNLGSFTIDSLPEGFAAAIESLAAGEISEPVVTASGTHLIKVLNKSEADVLVFAEERDRIERLLRSEQAAEKLAVYVEKLKDATYSADSLAPAAESLGLTIKESQSFSASGGEGIAAYPEIVKAAFSEDVLTHGYPSEVIEIGDQHYGVVKVKEFIPAHKAPLASVKPEIIETLLAEKAREKASRAADDILARIGSGESLESLAAEQGLTLETASDLTRFESSAGKELNEAIFGYPSSINLPVYGRVEVSSGDIAVYGLTKISEGSAEKLSDSEKTALRQSLVQQHSVREFIAYIDALEAAADISRR